METLQRLQPLDLLLAVVWAAIVGWGLRTGMIRQLGMLVGVYGATIFSGSLYRLVGLETSNAFGLENLPVVEFVAYVVLFVLGFGIIGILIWWAYPLTRLSRRSGVDNMLGAALAAIWGVLFVIALLTMLRFYEAVPWPDQEQTRRILAGELQRSQVAALVEFRITPLWRAMAPWFPAPVANQLSSISIPSIASISFPHGL